VKLNDENDVAEVNDASRDQARYYCYRADIDNLDFRKRPGYH